MAEAEFRAPYPKYLHCYVSAFLSAPYIALSKVAVQAVSLLPRLSYTGWLVSGYQLAWLYYGQSQCWLRLIVMRAMS